MKNCGFCKKAIDPEMGHGGVVFHGRVLDLCGNVACMAGMLELREKTDDATTLNDVHDCCEPAGN